MEYYSQVEPGFTFHRHCIALDEPEAFSMGRLLLMENADRLYAGLERRLKSYLARHFAGQEVEDCLQSGLIEAVIGLRRAPEGDPFRVAFANARWGALGHLKHWRAKSVPLYSEDLGSECEDAEEQLEAVMGVVDPYEGIHDHWEHRAVAEEVMKLATEKQRRVLKLLYWTGLSESECAEKLGCSRKNVRDLASWALNTYRRKHGLPFSGQSKRTFDGSQLQVRAQRERERRARQKRLKEREGGKVG